MQCVPEIVLVVACTGKESFWEVMAEEIIFEAEPFVETCNRLYSKWKVRLRVLFCH